MFIQISRISDVKKFVNLANQSAHIIDVKSEQHCVDAKSLLGLFSLNLDKPVEVIIQGCDDDQDAKLFYEGIQEFIVEPEEGSNTN